MNYVVMGIDRIGKDTFIEYNFPDYRKIHLTKPPKGVDPLLFSKTEYCDYFTNHLEREICQRIQNSVMFIEKNGRIQ